MWIYILPMLFISPIMTLSMNSWFSMWIMMELNLLMFIPLMIYMNKFYKEISMKYFIIQSFSSSMMIFSLNSLFTDYTNLNEVNFYSLMKLILNIALLIKIGSSPFHSWFINLMNNMNWMSCFMLSTWQKIIPMTMLLYLINNKMLIIVTILNCLTSMFGLNHQSIRTILSYSSINHLSWMLLNFLISDLLWMTYFLSYLFINWSIMFLLHKFNLFYINQMYLFNKTTIYMMLIFNFMSISGLPPMFGFMMKWYSIYLISNSTKIMFITYIILMMSILTFIFYTRIMVSMILINNIKNKFILILKIFPPIKINLKMMMISSSFMNLWMMSMWLS